MSASDLVLFDPFEGGHHADFLAWLAEAWLSSRYAGTLVLSLAPGVLADRPDLYETVAASEGRIRLDVLAGTEPLAGPVSLGQSARHHVRLIGDVVRRLQPRHVMAMYLDHAQAALALRWRGPTRYSGLLFRPDLHLPLPPGGKARLRQARKRLLLRALMRSPRFETLFTLDPTAVAALQRISGRVRAQAVPDPAFVEMATASPAHVREAYAVETGRTLFALPGALDDRKGIFATLDALTCLSEAEQQRVCVVFAGRATAGAAGRFETALEHARAHTQAQLVWDRRFLPGGELQSLIEAADVVLAPYHHHIGSSGIVMRAAAAERPLIGQTEGLVGHQIRTHSLGRVVPGGDVRALAGALRAAVREPTAGFDRARASLFCASHTTRAFADAVYGGLRLPVSEAPAASTVAG